MWELERTFVKRHAAPVTLRASRKAPAEQNAADHHGADQDAADHDPRLGTLAIVGRGRLGTALADALHTARLDAEPQGPFGRGYDGRGADVVLLCVPDAEIAAAAQLIVPGPLVGHCSGATALTVLAPHEAFSFHPLLPVIPRRTSFANAGAAVAGTTPQALAFATALARGLGMRPVEIEEQDRAAYHAA